jgi:hypothetical protein
MPNQGQVSFCLTLQLIRHERERACGTFLPFLPCPTHLSTTCPTSLDGRCGELPSKCAPLLPPRKRASAQSERKPPTAPLHCTSQPAGAIQVWAGRPISPMLLFGFFLVWWLMGLIPARQGETRPRPAPREPWGARAMRKVCGWRRDAAKGKPHKRLGWLAGILASHFTRANQRRSAWPLVSARGAVAGDDFQVARPDPSGEPSETFSVSPFYPGNGNGR